MTQRCQFVRKLCGSTKPSKRNEAAFERRSARSRQARAN